MVYNMLIIKFLFLSLSCIFLNEWANIGNFIDPINMGCSFCSKPELTASLSLQAFFS